MKASTLGMAAVMFLAPASWATAQISYSYVQGAYVVNEADTVLGEQDGAGPEVTLSYEVLPYLHVFGGYRNIELDDQPLETETLHAGVGFNLDLDQDRNLFFNLTALNAESVLDTVLGAQTADVDGYGASIGYREANQTRLEFTISLDWVEFDDIDDSNTSLAMSLQYEITPRFRAEGGVNIGGDDRYWKAGVRYYLPSFNRQ